MLGGQVEPVPAAAAARPAAQEDQRDAGSSLGRSDTEEASSSEVRPACRLWEGGRKWKHAASKKGEVCE